MTSIVLGPIFARPLHPQTWQRPPGNEDYRVTNGFDGPDYLNGGKHRATDCGNFGVDEPLRSPARCQARALAHFDGALGVGMELGGGVTLELWHLNRVDIPSTPTLVEQGARVGLTGNTGATLPNGKPMPAHTHIRAERDALPFDIEPHLFGAPLSLDDPDVIPEFTPVAKGVIAQGNNLRSDHTTASDGRVLQSTTFWDVLGFEPNGGRYTLSGVTRTDWAFVRRNNVTGWVAVPLVSKLQFTDAAETLIPQEPIDSTLQGKIDRARTAAQGTAQALAAAQRGNEAVLEALA